MNAPLIGLVCAENLATLIWPKVWEVRVRTRVGIRKLNGFLVVYIVLVI